MIDFEEIATSYGLKISTREEFFGSKRPEGLLERAEHLKLTHHAFVIWDPQDDAEGWMLWGDDRNALLAETCGPGGPLREGMHPYHIAMREKTKERVETQRPRQAPLMRRAHMEQHVLTIGSEDVAEYAGEIQIATIIPVRNSSQLHQVINAPIVHDGDGRSQWCWVRFANGDLMLGFFPQGDTYELASAMEQEDRTDG